MIRIIRYSLLLMMLVLGHLSTAQEIIQAEYFWDTDPGQGNGTSFAAADGSLDEAIEDLFESAVSIPSPGLHTFNVRVRGLDNTWGNTFSYVVNVTTPVLTSRNAQIVEAEYYWDTDPGQGNGTAILALDGNLDEVIEALFNSSLASPPAGLHMFNIRVRGEDNGWSNVFSYVVNVSSQSLITRDARVVQAEYFWDTDPGQGSATPILAADGSLDEVVEDLFNGTLASPPLGLHTFNIRVLGEDNSWSSVFSYVVNVKDNILITRDLRVVEAEYFWDTDPGQGNATAILALDGNLDEAIEDLFESAVSIPSPGLHTFNIRVRGLDNTWSNLFSYVVNTGSPTLMTRDVQVLQAEYFWDVDPGLGSANPILALDGNLDEAIEDVFQNTLVSTSVGLHTFNLRVQGEDNTWSNVFTHVVNVLDSNTYVTIDETICDGDTYTVPSGDESYTVAGTYLDTIPNVNGFDSIITINLAVNLPVFSTINPIACGSYESPALNIYTASGTYVETILSAAGCDSVITINLTITPNSTATINVGACDTYTSPSGNYVWTTSGTYMDTIPNAIGCDSVLTINLTISSQSTLVQNVSACDNYLWPTTGQTYFMSGTYRDTLLNVIGCDSIVVLNLSIFNSFNNTSSITACDSYTWPVNGLTYTSSGTYSINNFTVDGCDSSYVLNLTILNSTGSTTLITTCDSYLWAEDNNVYTASGLYTVTVPNSVGCDSVLTLDLTINSSDVVNQNVVDCDSYFWSETGLTYFTSGTYSVTYTNVSGCDSTINLNLTLGNTSTGTVSETACDSYFWSATGLTYTVDGIHTATLTTAAGCDSTVTLDLTIVSSSSATQTTTVCDSYLWPIDGNTYTTSGLYTGIISNSVGCDSVITLDLTVLNGSSSIQTITACDSYIWPENGMTYTNTGLYTTVIPNAIGCDSTITLDLTIGSSFNTTQIVSACDAYVWPANGNTYTSSGLYTANFTTALGCDSIINLDLTINTSSTAIVNLSTCDLYTWPLNGNSYASSGIYFATIPNAAGCDSVVTLNLTITNSSNTLETVTTCNTYTWPTNGQTYTVSGSYQAILTNAVGCDSLVTLDLTIGYSQTSSEVVTACDSYTWPVNGLTYTTSGTYSINGFTSLGCDSSYTLDLTIGTSTTGSQTIVACDSYTWPLNGMVYNASGVYEDTILNVNGCDSIVTLNLTINNSSSSSETITACNSYTWPVNGQTYSSSGTYQATLTNAAGCDSVLTLDLTINGGFTDTQTEVACGSYTWPLNGQTYTASGFYVETYVDVNGCDSVYNLDLTIGTNTTETVNVNSCGPYTWPLDGQLYANSGSYTTTITNANGCDSVVLLNLTVITATAGSLSVTACEDYTWSVTGINYTSTGSYIGTLTNVNGCDSTVTLNLTITGPDQTNESITECGAYTWPANGQTYTTSGTYSINLTNANGCDSIVTLDLTINTATANIFQTDNVLTASLADAYEWIDCGNNNTPVVGETGQSFTATYNSDFAVIVTNNGCTDTSACVSVANAHLAEFVVGQWQLYPNPTVADFSIDLNQVFDEVEVRIVDARGRLVYIDTKANTESFQISLDEQPGVYLVTIHAGAYTAVKRLVLQQ